MDACAGVIEVERTTPSGPVTVVVVDPSGLMVVVVVSPPPDPPRAWVDALPAVLPVCLAWNEG